MGMYDTINGEQVKCFPWVSLYKNKIDYHGGNCAYYNIGDEVPYKRPHYNYGKNFIILDLNRYIDTDYVDYVYIIHVIVDGRVKDTFENEFGDIDWSVNELVVGYDGEILNIQSYKDLLDYIKEQREYWSEYDKINSHWNELFKKSMKYYSGFSLLEDGSVKKKYRLQKIEKIGELMAKEKERIQPEIDVLNKSIAKWFVDISDIKDLISLGGYISAYSLNTKESKLCKEKIKKLLSSDNTLYDRYVEWQGSDEYIKEFKL